MNILEAEDMIKGMPDSALQREAQMPSGQVPQYLVVSEIQRRTDMRKKYQAQQAQPQGTVKDQVLQEGIASAMPMQQPMQQPVRMAAGGLTLGSLTLAGSDIGSQINRIVDMMPSDQAAEYFNKTFYASPEILNYALSRIDEKDIAAGLGASVPSSIYDQLPSMAESYASRLIEESLPFKRDVESYARVTPNRISSGIEDIIASNLSVPVQEMPSPSVSIPAVDTPQPKYDISNIIENLDINKDIAYDFNPSPEPDLLPSPFKDYGPSINIDDYMNFMSVQERLGLGPFSGDRERAPRESRSYTVNPYVEQDTGSSLDVNFPRAGMESIDPNIISGSNLSNIDLSELNSLATERALETPVGLGGFQLGLPEIVNPSIYSGVDVSALSRPDVLSRGAGDDGLEDVIIDAQIMEPSATGSAEVQGTSAIQTQAAPLSSVADGEPSIGGGGLSDLISEYRDQGRKDAMAQALIQLGAGIAGGDLSGGIASAGKAAYQARQDARKGILEERQLQLLADRYDNELKRAAKVSQQTLVQEAMRLASDYIKENPMALAEGQDPRQVLKNIVDSLVARYAPVMGVDLPEGFMSPPPPSTGGDAISRADLRIVNQQ